MPIDRTDFDAICEDDLLELDAAKVAEGLRIEYKRELYGKSDADKSEALKDISAFANSVGGHLIIGVEEAEGLPVGIPGVDAPTTKLPRLGSSEMASAKNSRSSREVYSSLISRHCFLIRVEELESAIVSARFE